MGEALRKADFKRVPKRINSQSSPVYGYRIKKKLCLYQLRAITKAIHFIATFIYSTYYLTTNKYNPVKEKD